MIGRVSRKTEADSLTFVNSFNKIAQEKGLNNAEDLKNYFFSDTYEFYWTVKPEDFFKKFEKDYQEFWTAEREAKLKNLGITKNQVYALASIVYKESGGKTDEQKTIAGLYLNRLIYCTKITNSKRVRCLVSCFNHINQLTIVCTRFYLITTRFYFLVKFFLKSNFSEAFFILEKRRDRI